MTPHCLFIRDLYQCLCSSGYSLNLIKLKYMNISTNLHFLFLIKNRRSKLLLRSFDTYKLRILWAFFGLLDAVSLACLRRAEKLWVKPLKAMKAISTVTDKDLAVGPPLVVEQCLNHGFQCPNCLFSVLVWSTVIHRPTTTPNTPPLP